MEYRELGKNGPKVSAIGVGCWAAGGWQWGGSDDIKTVEAFHRALELGINLFDTAPVYGFGHSESVLGPVVEANRDKIFLATKFGLVWDQPETASIRHELSPGSIRAECEASLRRLRTDHIDLYQAHWPLKEGMTRAVCESMIEVLTALRNEGKIRWFGVSNFTVEQMEWCGGAKNLTSLQPPFSILRPGAGRELIPWCREQGVGVLCYSPLFRGLLTGKYKGTETFPADDARSHHPDYAGATFKGICDAAQGMGEIAKARGTTISAVALNWALSTPGVTVALAGTRSKEQISEAAGAAGWSLTPEEMCRISGLFKDYAKVL